MVFSGSQSSHRGPAFISRPSQRGFWVKKHRQLETEHVILWRKCSFLIGWWNNRKKCFFFVIHQRTKRFGEFIASRNKPLPALGKMCLLSPLTKKKAWTYTSAPPPSSSPHRHFVLFSWLSQIKQIKNKKNLWKCDILQPSVQNRKPMTWCYVLKKMF